jgi:hypothetical protein
VPIGTPVKPACDLSLTRRGRGLGRDDLVFESGRPIARVAAGLRPVRLITRYSPSCNGSGVEHSDRSLVKYLATFAQGQISVELLRNPCNHHLSPFDWCCAPPKLPLTVLCSTQLINGRGLRIAATRSRGRPDTEKVRLSATGVGDDTDPAANGSPTTGRT